MSRLATWIPKGPDPGSGRARCMPVDGRTKGRTKRGGLHEQARAERPHHGDQQDVRKVIGCHRVMDDETDARKDLEGDVAKRNAKEGAGKANDLLPRIGDLGDEAVDVEHQRFSNRVEPTRPPRL